MIYIYSKNFLKLFGYDFYWNWFIYSKNFKNKNAYYHETKACENKIRIVYLNCIFFDSNDFFQKLNDWYPVFCCEIEGK